MIIGIIKDFFSTVLNDEKSKVEFLVKVKDSETYCTVKAEVPKDALKDGLIKDGLEITFNDQRVIIEIDGGGLSQNFAFIGYSSGGVTTSFYERKNHATP